MLANPQVRSSRQRPVRMAGNNPLVRSARHRISRKSSIKGAVNEATIGPLDEPGIGGLVHLPLLLAEIPAGPHFAYLQVEGSAEEAGEPYEPGFHWSGVVHYIQNAADKPAVQAKFQSELEKRLEDPEGLNRLWVGSDIQVTGLRELTVVWGPLVNGRIGDRVETPGFLASLKCIVNPPQDGKQCFKNAVLAIKANGGTGIKTNTQKISSYRNCDHLFDFTGLDPEGATLVYIRRFEALNPPYEVVIYEVIGETGSRRLAPHAYSQDAKELLGELVTVTRNRGPGKENHLQSLIRPPPHVIPLLLLEEGEKQHFAAIRPDSLHYLLLNCVEGKGPSRKARFPCTRCMRLFKDLESLRRHAKQNDCANEEVLIEMPEPGSVLPHRAASRQTGDTSVRSPVVLYYDFETFAEGGGGSEGGRSPSVAEHSVCGWVIVVVSVYEYTDIRGVTSKVHIYWRHAKSAVDDVMDSFLKTLRRIVYDVREKLSAALPLVMSEDDEAAFQAANRCYFCKHPFQSAPTDLRSTAERRQEALKKKQSKKKRSRGEEAQEPETKVRHHDHVTGVFEGAAHNSCNLAHSYGLAASTAKKVIAKKLGIPYTDRVTEKLAREKGYESKKEPFESLTEELQDEIKEEFRMDYKLNCFAHGSKNFDSHFLVQRAPDFKLGKVDVLAQNSERFITLGVGSLQFKDSASFLTASLDELASRLREEDLVHIRQHPLIPAGKSVEGALQPLRRKGVYPYNYMTGFARF